MLYYIEEYFLELWFLVLEMAPWLMLGLIFAGLLKVYFPQKHIDRYLGKATFRSVFNASIIGIPLPLCSCGVIPAGISFFRNGASKGATNSFLISTPQTGVDSIFATYSMLGWPFALLRPFVAFFTGIAGGALTNFFVKGKKLKAAAVSSNPKIGTLAIGKDDEHCNTASLEERESHGSDGRHPLIRASRYAFIELLQDIGKWLVIGFLLAALISVALPPDFFSSFRGLGLLELLVVLAASAPIYMCATGSIPIAAVLLMKGVSPGAALVFLMAGPATNIATMTVLGKTMGRKSLMTYMGTIIGGAVLFGLLINTFIPSGWIIGKMPFMQDDGYAYSFLPVWLQWASAVLLILLMAGGYFYSIVQKRKKMNRTPGISVKVTGMSCTHCETNVKQNLETLEGINHVIADNRSETVKITGPEIDLEKVKETVNNLGYKFVG